MKENDLIKAIQKENKMMKSMLGATDMLTEQLSMVSSITAQYSWLNDIVAQRDTCMGGMTRLVQDMSSVLSGYHMQMAALDTGIIAAARETQRIVSEQRMHLAFESIVERSDMIRSMDMGGLVTAAKMYGDVLGGMKQDMLLGEVKRIQETLALQKYWNGVEKMMRGLEVAGASSSAAISGTYDLLTELSYDVVQTSLEELAAIGETEETRIDFVEIKTALLEFWENLKAFQRRFAGWSEKAKKDFFVFLFIFLVLYGIFVEPYLQENIGIPVMTKVMSSLKLHPEKESEQVCRVCEGTNMMITENVNYYYKVYFIDENGIEREGYVAKRNVEIVKTDVVEDAEIEN